MAPHPRVEAEKYLESHNVNRLFRDLGTRLLYERPADQNAYLLQLLEAMQQDETKPFFTENDVRACFAAFDMHSTGSISAEQYGNAMRSFGIQGFEPLAEASIDREAFITRVLAEIAKDARYPTK